MKDEKITELDLNHAASYSEHPMASEIEMSNQPRMPSTVLAFTGEDVSPKMKESKSSKQFKSEQIPNEYVNTPQKPLPVDNAEPDSFAVSLLSPPSRSLSNSKSDYSS